MNEKKAPFYATRVPHLDFKPLFDCIGKIILLCNYTRNARTTYLFHHEFIVLQLDEYSL